MVADSPTQAPAPVRRRLRLPASRGGVAWLAVLVIVGAFLAAQVGRQVHANWTISRQAEAVAAEIAAVEAENQRLRRELAYLESDAYVSAAARRLTNLGLAGEQVLIIPPGAALEVPDELLPAAEEPRPLVEQWLDLFFGAR